MKKEVLKRLAGKKYAQVTDRDLEDGICVLFEDWDAIKAIADKIEYDEEDEQEYAYVDGYCVTYDPFESWDAEEI